MIRRCATPIKPSAKRKAGDKPRRTSQTFVWRHLKLRVSHQPNYITHGWSHIELQVLAPKGAPCPITSTGYLSHFLDESDLDKAGGAVAYFAAWLDREAKSKAWAKAEARWRQLDLFG